MLQFTGVPAQILMNYALSAPIHNILCFPCLCKRSQLTSWQSSCLLTSNTLAHGSGIHLHTPLHIHMCMQKSHLHRQKHLRPRVNCDSSPKKPPTMSSSAPKVGVCSIGEPAANMEGVNPVPLENSRSNVPIPPFGTCPALGCRLELPTAAPARLRVEAAHADPRALLACMLADLLGSLSSPKCFGVRPEPLLPGALRFVKSIDDSRPPPRVEERVVEGGPRRSFIHVDEISPGLMPPPMGVSSEKSSQKMP